MAAIAPARLVGARAAELDVAVAASALAELDAVVAASAQAELGAAVDRPGAELDAAATISL